MWPFMDEGLDETPEVEVYENTFNLAFVARTCKNECSRCLSV